MLIKIENDGSYIYPYEVKSLKADNPSTSFPTEVGLDTLADYGVLPVKRTDKPSGDVVTEGQPEQGEDGKWYQTWEVRDFTEAELAQQVDQRRADKLREINEGYSAALSHILADYPDAETRTWDKQEQEARAYAADNTATTPLLTEIANARGLTVVEFVSRVIANADAWIQLSGAATGKRHVLEERIGAATTVEDLEAIQW